MAYLQIIPSCENKIFNFCRNLIKISLRYLKVNFVWNACFWLNWLNASFRSRTHYSSFFVVKSWTLIFFRFFKIIIEDRMGWLSLKNYIVLVNIPTNLIFKVKTQKKKPFSTTSGGQARTPVTTHRYNIGHIPSPLWLLTEGGPYWKFLYRFLCRNLHRTLYSILHKILYVSPI